MEFGWLEDHGGFYGERVLGWRGKRAQNEWMFGDHPLESFVLFQCKAGDQTTWGDKIVANEVQRKYHSLIFTLILWAWICRIIQSRWLGWLEKWEIWYSHVDGKRRQRNLRRGSEFMVGWGRRRRNARCAALDVGCTNYCRLRIDAREGPRQAKGIGFEDQIR